MKTLSKSQARDKEFIIYWVECDHPLCDEIAYLDDPDMRISLKDTVGRVTEASQYWLEAKTETIDPWMITFHYFCCNGHYMEYFRGKNSIAYAVPVKRWSGSATSQLNNLMRGIHAHVEEHRR